MKWGFRVQVVVADLECPLQTVRVARQSKVEELSRVHDVMANLLNATDIATIFLDNALNIERHADQAKRVIRSMPPSPRFWPTNCSG